MNIAQHPELLDQLAARYAVGILKGGARRRLEAQARQNAAVRARILLWQERMHAMLELQNVSQSVTSNTAAAHNLRNVWKRIENSLVALPKVVVEPLLAWPPLEQAKQAFEAMRQKYRRWCAAAITAGLAAVMGWGLQLQSAEQLSSSTQQVAQLKQQTAALSARQQVQYVAVLADAQSAASILVTFDPDQKRLVLQRVGSYQEATDQSLQLWALPPGQAPQSLGVMSADKVLKLTAAPEQLRSVPTLAISLEPKGGVPSSRGPTGPVLFKGALLQTVL